MPSCNGFSDRLEFLSVLRADDGHGTDGLYHDIIPINAQESGGEYTMAIEKSGAGVRCRFVRCPAGLGSRPAPIQLKCLRGHVRIAVQVFEGTNIAGLHGHGKKTVSVVHAELRDKPRRMPMR
jgi:hypothetical protein